MREAAKGISIERSRSNRARYGVNILSELVRENRDDIIERCRVRVAARIPPRATESELEHGIPLFLDQLTARLHSKLIRPTEAASGAIHGGSVLRRGFTIGQVVQDYGDVCQTITRSPAWTCRVSSSRRLTARMSCRSGGFAPDHWAGAYPRNYAAQRPIGPSRDQRRCTPD